MFYSGRGWAGGAAGRGPLPLLAESIDGGFSCFEFMARDPWLASLRGEHEFAAILRRCEANERRARIAFLSAGGDKVLGLEP